MRLRDDAFPALMAGWRAGHFELPADVEEAQRACDRLDAAFESAETKAQVTTGDVIESMVAAALAGEAIPDASQLVADRRAAEISQETVELVGEARGRAERMVRRAVAGKSTTIIKDFLRPTLKDTLAQATQHSKSVAHLAADGVTMMSAPAAVQKSWAAMEQLSDRYRAIRAAFEELRLKSDPEVVGEEIPVGVGDAAWFSEFANAGEVWPTFMREHFDHKYELSPPWPKTYPARLIWVVSSAAEAWLPLPAEQRQAFERHLTKANAELHEAISAARHTTGVAR